MLQSSPLEPTQCAQTKTLVYTSPRSPSPSPYHDAVRNPPPVNKQPPPAPLNQKASPQPPPPIIPPPNKCQTPSTSHPFLPQPIHHFHHHHPQKEERHPRDTPWRHPVHATGDILPGGFRRYSSSSSFMMMAARACKLLRIIHHHHHRALRCQSDQEPQPSS